MLQGAQAQQLTGQVLVDTFLQELSVFIRRSPDHEFTGTPKELVEEVVLRTTKFSECKEGCIENLSRQVAMAVRSKGRPYHLRYEILGGGRIKVAFG